MKSKILIADDEPNILMLTSIMLEDLGYETILAKNGAQAIDLALKFSPDLIITDIVMPEKDGFEVCRILRSYENFKDVPIIILSAIGDEFNKITGFEGGADDYITKPFSLDELKSRVEILLQRHQNKEEKTVPEETDAKVKMDRVSTGSLALDEVLNGGFPKGSNILLTGQIGCGKSSLGRKFLTEGLLNKERCIYVAIDDAPDLVRKKMTELLPDNIESYQQMNLFSVVDAYSWSSGSNFNKEKFRVEGMLDLNQLSLVIADAGQHIGQSIQNKVGGRRLIDSISSLLINFDLSVAQRFLSQIARTSLAFGMVNTLFILEEGTVSDCVLNNVKYIMDGVVEVKVKNDNVYARVASMKWIEHGRDWVKIV